MIYDIWCITVNQWVELLIIYPLEKLWTLGSWKSRFRTRVLYINSLSQSINKSAKILRFQRSMNAQGGKTLGTWSYVLSGKQSFIIGLYEILTGSLVSLRVITLVQSCQMSSAFHIVQLSSDGHFSVWSLHGYQGLLKFSFPWVCLSTAKLIQQTLIGIYSVLNPSRNPSWSRYLQSSKIPDSQTKQYPKLDSRKPRGGS